MANSADPDQKPTHLDLHCLQRQDLSGLYRTRVKIYPGHAQSHPGICSPLIHSVVSNDSVSGQQRHTSDCACAQSDVGLRYPLHVPKACFPLLGLI